MVRFCAVVGRVGRGAMMSQSENSNVFQRDDITRYFCGGVEGTRRVEEVEEKLSLSILFYAVVL